MLLTSDLLLAVHDMNISELNGGLRQFQPALYGTFAPESDTPTVWDFIECADSFLGDAPFRWMPKPRRVGAPVRGVFMTAYGWAFEPAKSTVRRHIATTILVTGPRSSSWVLRYDGEPAVCHIRGGVPEGATADIMVERLLMLQS